MSESASETVSRQSNLFMHRRYKMGDPFVVCLVRPPRCLSFFSSSLFPSHTNNLRSTRTPHPHPHPLRFPKPRTPATTLSNSSSQLDHLISTTECLDGSVLFRFGDESEKAAFDDEVNSRRLTDQKKNVITADDDEAELSLVTLGDNAPSANSKDVSGEVKPHTRDVSGASTPRTREVHTLEGSEVYPSIYLEDDLADGESHRIDAKEASTPTPVELDTVKGSEGYLSTKSEEELTEGEEPIGDISVASTPSKVESNTVESSNTQEEVTEGKTHRRDISGASTPGIVDLHIVEGSEEYPSSKSIDEFTKRKECSRKEDQFTDASGALIPGTVELVTGKHAKGYPIADSVVEHTENNKQRGVLGASTPIIMEMHTVEGAEGYPSRDLECKVSEGNLESEIVSRPTIHTTAEFPTVEDAERYPITNSGDEMTEGKEDRDILRVSTPTITELNEVEGAMGANNSAAVSLVSSSAALLPHPSKALAGGEDAYFVDSGNWLGVADGVSRWSLEGTKPGIYAREFMENCVRFLTDCKGIPLTRPEDVLVGGAKITKISGSSTVLVAYFDGQALHVANIGNSGFMIVRNGAVYKRSSPMVHGINFPVQIVTGDDPTKYIQRYRIDLDEGDVIVTATDGLFDNLYEQEITSIVTKSLQAGMRLQDIAKFLATSAQEVGQSTSRRSPFADTVEASGYVRYTGGKLDDVTVILSHVLKKSSCC